MSEVISYKHIALDWQPDGSASRQFNLILLAAIVLSLGVAITISTIKVPEVTWEQRAKVPDRIANYIAQQPKKLEKPIELPKPKPVPKPQPKPVETQQTQPKADVTVSRLNPGRTEDKPLTQTQEKARNVAQQSGLLALASEMDELRDTSDINQNVRARLSTASTDQASTHKLDAISAETNKAGRTIDQDKLVGQVETTNLQTRETKTNTAATEKATLADAQKKGAAGGRGISDVGLVFNKNKAGLYALYERERRKNAGLKGRIVFQLTIEPSGKVSNVKIVSSELNNPALETRILARIKLFMFAPAEGETVTVTYPVEFIPS
ncbi:MAG TPA: AgmX/PglI C-terminal domain-containing protein [Cellvibrio sp.]|nr:AgmX/PglI C-terminal domain-containing protein [Cellvibrio sp.]